ncbi:MAG TPA: hypothetical protein VJ643_09460, partial [Nitrososphaera sp.]|nr:hypothetical protein [Nitrososphaera sp.]
MIHISYQQAEFPFDEETIEALQDAEEEEEEEPIEEEEEEPIEEEEEACIDYDSTENTIAINCDASFLDVVQAINDPEILEQEEEQEGQYILNANLEVADGVTFEMTSSGDGLQYLKLAGENGIIVYGTILID